MREEIYEEYKQEHPEELVEIKKIHGFTAKIERDRGNRISAKLHRIEECRGKLNGKHTG